MTLASDFAVIGAENVTSAAELATLLRDTRAEAVRLCGTASSFARLPAPRRPVLLVSLAAMRRIDRLDPFDLTCSVEPGLERADLDGELRGHGLELPSPGTGTIGGMLARGEHQPLAPGATCARNVVLGLEGVLADGTQFKVGARVVKSVAGFDVHRAFVGSRGRLLAATLIHLRLRRTPRASMTFAQDDMPLDAALGLFRALRLLPTPPHTLLLQRQRPAAFSVAGRVDGADAHVRAIRERFGLRAVDRQPSFGLTGPVDREVVDGVVQPSALPGLLGTMPPDAPLQVSGTGQFQVVLAPAASDALLACLPGLPGGAGEIRCGTPARRGRATPVDRAAARLEAALRTALDPRGLLQ